MLKPRNTVVVLSIIEKSERKQGKIVVPTNGELYAEAEVVAVGPGGGTVAGGNTETFDLKVGQLVFLQAKRQGRGPAGHPITEYAGVRYVVDDKTYFLYEQTAILGIVAEPGEWTKGETTPEQPKSKLILN
jgi:co-chaperonin GroES (HSP10)